MPYIFIGILLIFLSFPYSSYGKSSSSSWQSLCKSSQYKCVHVKRGQSWQKLFPDETERGIVMRINHTNQRLYSGKTILVPNNLEHSNLLDYSPLSSTIDPPQEKEIIVDLNKNAWGAYDPNGRLVKWGPASGGSSWCRDLGRPCRTKSGHFRIHSLGSSECKSTKFPIPRGGAPMPYCMYFNGGQALHGSPGEVARGNISHGCVRLFVDDAEWLRNDFVDGPSQDNNYQGTKVIVLPY